MIVSSSRQPSDSLGPSTAAKTNQRNTGSDMEWRRSGEPGSAFRGLTKPRGNGRGGGRAVRGGGRGTHHAGSEGTDKDVAFSVTAAATLSVNQVSTAPSEAEPVSPARIGKQKAPRKITTATSEESLRPPPSQTSRSSNRRRRSNQGNKVSNSTSNPTTNRHLAAEPNDRRAVTGPSTPSVAAKDLPPHLAPSSDIASFDIRNNINALVERVRAVAMDRPRTPGSHIDWAGDDDDSLPDLDDWGVTSSKGGSVHGEHEKISPILEDSELSPLPTIPLEKANVPSKGVSSQPSSAKVPNGFKSQTAQRRDSSMSPGAEPVPEATPRAHKLEKVRSKRGTRSRGNSRTQQVPPTIEVKEVAASDPHVSARSHGVLSPKASLPTIAKSEPTPTPPTSAKLHPSLPPKPVSSIEHVRLRGQNNAASATPMRNSPAKPGPDIVVDTLVEVKEVKVGETLTSAASEEKKEGVEKSETHSVLVPLPEPLPRRKTASPHAFNPAHERAHTLGHLGDVQPPHGAPTSAFDHASRFDNSNLLKPPAAQHTRNHSSPPAGHGFIRTPHPTRPILTGDAISRLARTLGTRDVSPRREPPIVALVKD